MTLCGSVLLVNGIFIQRKETVPFDFAENNVNSVTRRAATFPVGHNFTHSENLPFKVGI